MRFEISQYVSYPRQAVSIVFMW